jgi:hypothetical protein
LRTRASKALAPPGVMSVSVRIDSIGTRWRTLVKPSQHLAAHALRRRIGGAQFGVLGLQRLQALEQPVVFGVGQAGASST